jgi:hypothetical protein
VLAAILALFGLLGGARATPFAGPLPIGVPDGDALGWQRIDGDVTTAKARVVYALFVNPARDAIYEVARYQVTWLASGDAAANRQTEKLLWNEPRSAGGPPRCFAREGDAWRVLAPDSEEYRTEMGTAMQVYGLHRSVRLKGAR